MTIEEFYQYCFNKLVEHNKNNCWVHPKYYINDPILEGHFYFMVQLESYLEIEWPEPIVVYRIRQNFQDSTNIFCKVVL
jgi:hypothetical protein